MTAPDAAERRYGRWSVNPTGRAEQPTRCVQEVDFGDRWFVGGHQCARRRGYGPDGLYCKQHAKRFRAEG